MVTGLFNQSGNDLSSTACPPDTMARSLKMAKNLRTFLHSKKAKILLDYYIKIHPHSHLPSREDFNPMAIPSVLPNLVLVDVCRAPYRFKYRLAGTSIYDNWGFDPTGQYLDTLISKPNSKHSQIDRVAVVATRQPIHRYEMPDLDFRMAFKEIEYLHLPFSRDGENVDMILSLLGYGDIDT